MDRVPIICDYGSGFSKVGFAGKEAPLAIFPTILGKLRHDTILIGMEEEDWFIGDDTQKNREKLILQYPISRGAINSWDNLEKIWHHSFYQVLRTPPEEHPLMVTESPLNSTSTKEKVCQILFETFNVPALSLINQGVLSLYASGQTSGTTIESGEGMTYFVPIADGCPLHQSTFQLDVAGQDLTWYLLQLLTERGILLVGTGRSAQGIHMMTTQCITSCHPDLQKTLFSHILLSGGTGSFTGLRLRLQRELAGLVSPTIDVKVSSSPYGKCSAWVGGSILGSLSTFKDMWVTRGEYRDVGCSIINRKSF
ncbi:PREDICTED: actin-like isoform X2 [Chinchilla lanigera]|uniref:actin-like isoform X2 n=1 Tax=Chinchilla lanigera TaxID=34839 RepID=UPI0006974C42|nr:PREDICTED: actin-like isoform X2 [Chinchilla lanigera]